MFAVKEERTEEKKNTLSIVKWSIILWHYTEASDTGNIV